MDENAVTTSWISKYIVSLIQGWHPPFVAPSVPPWYATVAPCITSLGESSDFLAPRKISPKFSRPKARAAHLDESLIANISKFKINVEMMIMNLPTGVVKTV